MSAVPLQISGVGKDFTASGRRRAVLAGVDLEVAAGEVVALLGPSGCGKSTLLRLAGGLDTPTAGRVLVDGQPVRDFEPRCAVVFQEPRLLPWRTLERNVAYGLPRDVTGDRAREEVAHWLSVVGLADFAKHRPRQVSGGMAQRAALARALARRPGVLLLDEPFAALDALTRLRMQDLLAEVQREAGTTVLLVTHDVDEALHLADRIVLLGAARADAIPAGQPAGPPGGPPAGPPSLGEPPQDSVAESGSRGRAPWGRRDSVDNAASIRLVLDVPGVRPRDRGDAGLATLRSSLLGELGVRTPAAIAS